MKSLSALEINYMLKELDFLVNGKVDKIYHPSKKELIIQFFVSGKGKFQLRVNEKSLYLTEKFPSESPSEFCMYLRKKLQNSRLRKIEQLGFERIISLEFETKEEKFNLIFELFSKGNILLTKDNIVLSAVEYQKWASRTIRPKAVYVFPKRDFNFLDFNLNDFLQTTSKSFIVKALASDLGLGGLFAEEACRDIDKNKSPKDLSDAEIKKLQKALDDLKDKKLDPQLVFKNNVLFDVVPFKLSFYKDFKYEKIDSFSQGLQNYFSRESELVQFEKIHKGLDKIANVIVKQKQQIKDLEDKEVEFQKAAEVLYSNYQLVSGILKELNKALKTHSWKEVQSKLKGHKIIKQVFPKDKSIIVEL